MEGAESVLESIYEEVVVCGDETLENDGVLEDVEMLDAETLDGRAGSTAACGDKGREAAPAEGGCRGKNQRRRSNKKKGKKRKSGSSASITDINRFVIDTCKHLKEKKSYLVWNAVGSLGVSAVSDLVKEVDAIHGCGGQRTADGRRFRTGGGILWNILKTREPKAYKEIMAKGREFEVEPVQNMWAALTIIWNNVSNSENRKLNEFQTGAMNPSLRARMHLTGQQLGENQRTVLILCREHLEEDLHRLMIPTQVAADQCWIEYEYPSRTATSLKRVRFMMNRTDFFFLLSQGDSILALISEENYCPLSLVVRWDFFRKGMYLLPLALHMALIFHLARTCM